jgi:predicted component of type VI protein secretion system
MNVSQSKNSSKSQSKKKKNPVPSSELVEKINNEEAANQIPMNYEIVQ